MVRGCVVQGWLTLARKLSFADLIKCKKKEKKIVAATTWESLIREITLTSARVAFRKLRLSRLNRKSTFSDLLLDEATSHVKRFLPLLRNRLLSD